MRITEAEIKDTNDALALSKTQWSAAATAIAQSQQRIASIGKEMREVDSFYRSLIAGSKEYAQTTAGLNDKLSAFKEKYHLQSDALAEYKNQLAAAKEQLQAAQAVNDPEKIRQATDAVTDAYAALNEATAAIRTMEAEIEETNEALALSRTNWESAGKEIKQTEQAITSIGKQLKQAESRFKLAAAGVKDFDKSAEGLTAKLTLLSENSSFKGICRKVLILLLVGVAHIIDTEVVGTGSAMHSAVIAWYLSNEGVSVCENASRLGLPIPEKLKEVLVQLHKGSNPALPEGDTDANTDTDEQ